ncbi:glutathione S-transferase family protein [Enterovirga rhinocerotis]|uniref:Glutathione S-transferase n=1 Tax=Enterovirga rhinocerotis TaxID=1339210 RepID=A0A4R7C982_9HYPH|nr:glutathione S-transferase family protein [Enterovirga rhinocerotis]TDR94853.1 glutathione S-transferase [Enterovirga rhinocerotis]
MITLHHATDTRSFRVLWALEELGLPYELRMLPFPPRALARAYLDENPLGTVPLLVDGHVRMTESAAICHYLATRDGQSPLALDPVEADYGAYLNWLHFGEATLTFPQAIVLRYGRFEPSERRLPQAVADYGRWFTARLRAVESALGDGRETLCGDRFTMADVSVGYALLLADITGLAAGFTPGVAAYWERLAGRPAYRAAREAQDRAGREQGVAATDLRAG